MFMSHYATEVCKCPNKSAEVEHYLHIGRAKEVFEQYAYLHGKERVSELNRVFII